MKLFIAALTLMFSASAAAGCYKIDWSDPPTIPNGAEASTGEMLEARREVVAFVERGEHYLQCGSVEPFIHNIIAHQLEVTAAQFNAQRASFLEQRSAIAAN